jgi:hypothetical protein
MTVHRAAVSLQLVVAVPYPSNLSQSEQKSTRVSFMILPAEKLTEQVEDLNGAGKPDGRRFF